MDDKNKVPCGPCPKIVACMTVSLPLNEISGCLAVYKVIATYYDKLPLNVIFYSKLIATTNQSGRKYTE